MVYSFYFLLVGSRRNECNSLWEELRGRGQKSTATQKVCLPPFLLALTLHLLWSILFIFCVLAPYGMNEIVFGKIGENIRSLLLARKVSLSWNFIYLRLHYICYIILSRYIVCLDVCHALYDAHLVARIPRYS